MFSSRKIFSIFFLFLSFMAAKAQEGKNSLTVEQSLELALKNYPLAGQRELISRGSELESAILQKQYLPQLNIKGRATYQSEVTAIPLELSENTVPRIDKDHYKVYAEMDQLLFDGGTISNEQDLLGIVQQMQAYELDMKLYPIKNKVNQLFFAVLILRDHIALNKMLEKDVELGLEKVRVAIENGTALRSEGYRLNVSLLKIQQRTIALESSHRSTLSMLASYIGIPIGDDTQLVKPVIPNNLAGEIKRPELYFYDYHIEKYNIQNKLLNKKVIPRLSFFAQGGYGRPTLNLLSNDFSSYYLAGLQLKWSLSEFYTLGKEKETNTIQQQQIASQRESFLFDVQREIDDRDRAIVQYQKQLETDDAIIEMQRLIKKTSLTKLTNGTIDANEYLSIINEENQALLNKSIRETNLLRIHFEKAIATGNL